MSLRATVLATIVAACVTYGCSRDVVEPPSMEPASGRAQALAASGATPVSGYRHQVSRSRFWRASPNKAEATSSLTRYTGDDRMMIVLPNGFVSASVNAKSPARSLGAFSANSDVHNAHVVDYFTEAGLPTAQMSSPHVTTRVRATGSEVGGETERHLLGYTTVINRIVLGVRVEGSFAWAEFNKAGEVIAEQVWWPELPASVVDDVSRMVDTLQSTSTGSLLRSKLPVEVKTEPGEVVIHHEPPIGRSFKAAVTLDFARPGRQTTLSYDLNGDPVRFLPDADPVGDSRVVATAAALAPDGGK
ncbi:hypothetical protein BH11MYX4_BH11MYX4_33110 [soil metagenome]